MVDIRQLITEIMEYQEAQGKTEADALAYCIAEVRRRKDSLMDSFWEQFIDSAVRDVWGSVVQRHNQNIRDAMKDRRGNQAVDDNQGEHASTPETEADGGDLKGSDAQCQHVSPAGDEGDGSDHRSSENQGCDVAPTPRQEWLARKDGRNLSEATKEGGSIADMKVFPGSGIGRIAIRDMNVGMHRKARDWHMRVGIGHYNSASFHHAITGDQWGMKGQTPDDIPTLERWTETELEQLYIDSGRPPIDKITDVTDEQAA